MINNFGRQIKEFQMAVDRFAKEHTKKGFHPEIQLRVCIDLVLESDLESLGEYEFIPPDDISSMRISEHTFANLKDAVKFMTAENPSIDFPVPDDYDKSKGIMFVNSSFLMSLDAHFDHKGYEQGVFLAQVTLKPKNSAKLFGGTELKSA